MHNQPLTDSDQQRGSVHSHLVFTLVSRIKPAALHQVFVMNVHSSLHSSDHRTLLSTCCCYLPKSVEHTETNDIFEYTDATSCLFTTYTGQMSTKSACYKDLRVQVNTSYCNPRSRPATGVVPCNSQPCPARSEPLVFTCLLLKTHSLGLVTSSVASHQLPIYCLLWFGSVLVSAQRLPHQLTASDSPHP